MTSKMLELTVQRVDMFSHLLHEWAVRSGPDEIRQAYCCQYLLTFPIALSNT